MVADTSREAYDACRPQFGPQQARILGFLSQYDRPMTRGEIAALTGLPINCVCGRVNELVKAEALIELPARKCKFSGRSAHPVCRPPQQMEMVA